MLTLITILQGLQLGPLKRKSIEEDSPFGTRGTKLWLCDRHATIIDQWNAKKFESLTPAVEAATQVQHDVCHEWSIFQASRACLCIDELNLMKVKLL